MKMLGRYLLDKKPAAKRKKKGCTFNEANSVAILYHDKGEDHFKKIKSIVADLHGEYGIKSVLAMGFVDQKKKAVPIYQLKKLEYTYLCKDDLKWNKLPNHEANQFMNQEFDLLLDLFQEEHLALEYLWKGSKAKMKVSTNSSVCAATADLIAATEKQTDIKSIFKTYQNLLTKYNLK
jgi:hypothetical protein